MEQPPEIIIIAAMAENRVIGKNNALPWSIREDMIHFKELTLGYPCIMGRKTWESLPKKPLPGRLNIVISSRGKMVFTEDLEKGAAGRPPAEPEDPEGVLVFPSLGEAIRRCRGCRKVFVCGGASVYREAVSVADAIELTVIHAMYEGDVFFPEIDPRQWRKISCEDYETFSFIRYNRRQIEAF
ncbi:MAG: dihydrofolate reductase [Treponema sp.]|jgi:dihydrofolate reductase|nr:dihydrofolate reductase [Treponema sp.]